MQNLVMIGAVELEHGQLFYGISRSDLSWSCEQKRKKWSSSPLISLFSGFFFFNLVPIRQFLSFCTKISWNFQLKAAIIRQNNSDLVSTILFFVRAVWSPKNGPFFCRNMACKWLTREGTIFKILKNNLHPLYKQNFSNIKDIFFFWKSEISSAYWEKKQTAFWDFL